MATTRFSEDVRAVSDLKTKASEIVEQVSRSRRPVLLTRRGRGVAVLVELEEYELLVDRACFLGAVEVGLRAAAEGDLHPDDDATKILDTFGETGP